MPWPEEDHEDQLFFLSSLFFTSFSYLFSVCSLLFFFVSLSLSLSFFLSLFYLYFVSLVCLFFPLSPSLWGFRWPSCRLALGLHLWLLRCCLKLAVVGLVTGASLAVAALLLRGLPALWGLVAFLGFGLLPLAADHPMARLPCLVAWCWLWFAVPPLAVAACCSRAFSAGWCLWLCHLEVVRGPSAGVVVVAALCRLRPGFLF